jgi:pyruvate dehydrogenase E1 component alpha subunit
MPGVTVDGNDALAVYETARAAVARARAGDGPSLLNMETYRYGGHFVGDAEEYRAREDVEAWRGHDPIPRLEARLLAAGELDEAARTLVWEETAAEVAQAERFAEESPYPDASGALQGVFTP